MFNLVGLLCKYVFYSRLCNIWRYWLKNVVKQPLKHATPALHFHEDS